MGTYFDAKDKKLSFMYLCIVVLGYLLFVFNRYLPVQEGWFQYDVLLIDNGKLPYRDFYLHIQPLYLYMIYALEKIFGPYFIYLRAYGVIERIIIVCSIFYVLRKQFNDNDAFIVTVFGVFFYSSFNVDLTYSYYQTSLLLSLASAIFFERGLKDSETVSCFYIIAGIMVALLFFTKQSTGMVFFAGLLAVLLIHYLRLKKHHEMLIAAGYYLIGFTAVAFSMLAWLVCNNALGPYFKVVFLASESKGPIFSILFGFVPRLWRLVDPVYLIVILLFIVSTFFVDRMSGKTLKYVKSNDKSTCLYYSVTVMICYIYAYFRNSVVEHIWILRNLYNITQYIIVVCSMVIVAAIVYYQVKWYAEPSDEKIKMRLYWIVIAFMMMYSHGMSGILEAQAFIFALPLAMLLWWSTYQNNKTLRIVKGITILFGLLIVVMITSQKYSQPYYWWGWGEPNVRTANENSSLKELKGMKISLRSKNIYEKVCSIILKNTTKKDDVFFFPHNTLFNVLTGRTYNNYTTVCYFDVCSDKHALQAAKYLEYSKPKMIIHMIFPDEAWKTHEDIFRQGKTSGQREILSVITKMKEAGFYERIELIDDPLNYPIEVLKRTDHI